MFVIKHNNELILDNTGRIQRFKSAGSARDYLRDIGVRKPEKEGFLIIPQSESQGDIQPCSK